MRPAVWLAVIVLVSAGGCGDQEDRSDGERTPSNPYVGLTYREPPPGIRDLGGALIGGIYAVSRMQRPPREMLWLNKRVSAPEARLPRWRVLGVLNLPPLRRGEVVAIGTCDIASRRYQDAVAVWPTDRGAEAPARLAWLANGPARRFEPIEPGRVNCREELAG